MLLMLVVLLEENPATLKDCTFKKGMSAFAKSILVEAFDSSSLFADNKPKSIEELLAACI